MNLDDFRVKDVPKSLCYIPNFISAEDEAQLWQRIYAAPKPKWTVLSNRRLQEWGGSPRAKGMIAEKMPSWLQPFLDKVSDTGAFGTEVKPNHVLINEYLAGQGIMPHTDGPMYYPTVTTISLGSHAVIKFYEPLSEVHQMGDASASLPNRHIASILLEPRSLFVVQDDMYSHYLHGIGERTCDEITADIANLRDSDDSESSAEDFPCARERSTRISLTIRNVPKVLKLPSLFKM